MTRATGYVPLFLCLAGLLSPISGQQPPVAVNPDTGPPASAADQHDKEIDKYDPAKPDSGSTQNTGSQSATSDAAALPTTGTSQYSTPGASTDASNTNGAEYAGPAVLSRSYTLARPMVPEQISWKASVGFDLVWNDGQAPIAVNGQTSSQSTTSEAGSLTWALSGRQIWRRDQFGVAYTGIYSQYFNLSNLSGINNSLNLDYSHEVSRRLSFQLVESLQDFSQNYSLLNPVLETSTSVANINLATSPSVQFLNSTTRQSASTGSMTFHQTSRLSYNISGSYFIIGRTEGVGMTGNQAGGDMNYRWTRRATIGAYYSFTNYAFSHNIASADSHGGGMIYSYAISRRTQLQTRLGATRIEGLAYESVPIPPALAAILGQNETTINAYSLRWIPDISVQLVRAFGRSHTATLAYAHGESPGNGVLLTSVQQTISAGYEVGLSGKRLSLSTGLVYSTLDSAAQGTLSFYRSETAHVSVTRAIGRSLHASLGFNYLRYAISGTPLLQHNVSISLGFSWSPPENFVRF